MCEKIKGYFLEDKLIMVLIITGFGLIFIMLNLLGVNAFPVIPTANMLILFALMHRLGQLLHHLRKITNTCEEWNRWKTENEKQVSK